MAFNLFLLVSLAFGTRRKRRRHREEGTQLQALKDDAVVYADEVEGSADFGVGAADPVGGGRGGGLVFSGGLCP